MNVGFAVVSKEQQLVVDCFGKKANEANSLVELARDGDRAVVLMGRLYYREDWLARLGAAAPNLLTHAELALSVYRQYGTDGLKQLEGDFALVVVDHGANIILGMRDPLGGYPLYWLTSADALAIGTSLYALTEYLPRRAINLDYVADYLMLPSGSVQEIDAECCIHEGIQRVRAGTMVALNLATRSANIDMYWDWTKRRVDPGTDGLDEIGDRFGELLRQAVRTRLHGGVAAHFSGGMDSTAIALLARDALGENGGPVHALSLVAEKLPILSAETPYVECGLAGQRGLISHRLNADTLLDFSPMDEGLQTDEPYPFLFQSAISRALEKQAAQLGVQTVLTGTGGDLMTEVKPFYIGDLVRRGRLWAAWSQAARWARAGTGSTWQMLATFGLANLVPASVRPGLRVWLRGGYASWQRQSSWTIPPWIRHDFAKKHGLRRRSVANLRRMYYGCRPTNVSVAIETIRLCIGDSFRWTFGAEHGMVLTHPFLDPRLLCYGLGIQARVRTEPGVRKPILVRALRDVLPEKILNRRGKGHFNEIFYGGLAQNVRRLEKLILETPADDVPFLDKNSLLPCLHQAAVGIGQDVAGVDRLVLTLSLLDWIARVKQRGRLKDPAERICL